MTATKEQQTGYFLAVDADGNQYCILVIEELAGYRTDGGAAEWVHVQTHLREINGGTVSRYAKGEYILAARNRAIDPLGRGGPYFSSASPEYIKITSDDPNAV